jgi:hypothetical protein
MTTTILAKTSHIADALRRINPDLAVIDALGQAITLLKTRPDLSGQAGRFDRGVIAIEAFDRLVERSLG